MSIWLLLDSYCYGFKTLKYRTLRRIWTRVRTMIPLVILDLLEQSIGL
jgi:hypothetical protein